MIDALLRRLWDEFGRRSSGTNEWVGKGSLSFEMTVAKLEMVGCPNERALGVGSEVTHDG
jgi:hypothetical protein